MSVAKRFDTLKARVAAGQATLIAGLVVVALIGVSALGTLGDTVSRQLEALTSVSEISNGLVVTLYDEMRSGEQYLTDRSIDAQQGFREAGAQSYAYQGELRALPDLTEGDRLLIARIGELQAEVEVWYSLAHAQFDLARRREAEQTVRQVREPAQLLLRLVQAFSAQQRERADRIAQELEIDSARRRLLVWTVLAASIFVGLGVGVTTLRSIERPLTRLEAVARRFGEGDLRPVEVGRMPRELQSLSDAMARISTKLRALVENLVSESERIASTATDLSAVSEQLAATAGEISTAMVEVSSGAGQQVSGLERSSTALDDLRATAERNGKMAERVAQLGNEIHRLAVRYQEDVAASAAALLELGDVVQTSASQVEELDRLSEGVYDFVELIKRISSQTNLLALNAQIEAARAGERGIGFAVVADEVRQLADSSAGAAEQVSDTLHAVRSQVGEVSGTMAAGRTKVQGVESIAQGAARALEEIAKAIGEVESAAARLRDEAAKNLTAAEQIRREVARAGEAAQAHASSSQEVAAAAEQQGASTEEMAAQANQLNAAAERLRGLVQGFRI
ncbi:MAG: methyl-accepting chemotaxis protein [Gemmatimonadota bacterium]|nr:MAG: methyl-accepting chemotaxis protein [Gemmatimonadota bacterium]